MKKTIALLFALLCLTINSCSDDDNGTNPDISERESFEFPLALGNEWTYGYFDLDNNFNIKEEVLYEYKATIINRLEYKGKLAYEVDEDTRMQYKYYSVDENAIYGHADYENLSSDGKTIFPNDWMKIYDFNNNTWNVYSKQIDIELEDYKAEGTIMVNGEKTGKRTALINNIEIDFYEFRIIAIANSKETIGEDIRNETIIDTTYLSIADGIGLYSITKKDYEIDEEDPDFGWAEKVIDYNLKPE